MKNAILALTVALTLGAFGLVWAEEMAAPTVAAEATQAAAEMATDAASALESAATEMQVEAVNNTICPLSGRELRVGGEEIALLEYNGIVYNVCPMAKAEYDKNPAAFADKMAQFVSTQSAQAEEMKEMAGEMIGMAGGMQEMATEVKEMAE